MRQLDLQSLLAAVDVPVDWVGIREVTETHSPRVVRDGVPEVNGCFTTQGLMVEVLADGQFGYYGTPNMTDIGISDAAKKAYGQAKLAANHATYKFTDAARPANVGSYESPFVKEMDTISPGELNKILLDAYTQLKVSDKIVSARAVLQTIQMLTRFVSSNGSDITQDFLMLEFDLSATAADGANQQTRTFGGMRGTCRQMGMEFFDKWELLAIAQKIGEQAIELLDADQCPTGEMDLVIASDQMMLQIHESVGHA